MQDYIPRTIDINEKIKEVGVKQYDNNSRFLHVQILDKDAADGVFDLDGCSAVLYIQPENNEDPSAVAYINGEVSSDEESGNVVTFLLPGSVTQNIGKYECEIWIYQGSENDRPVISTKPFLLTVEKSIRNTNAIMASSQYSALDAWAADVQSLKNEMAALVASPAGSGGDVGTEMRDIRIGCDGTEYESAGAAVRGQAAVLNSEIDNLTNTLITGEYHISPDCFAHGYITSGGNLSLNDEITHRLTMTRLIKFSTPIKLSVIEGYRLYIWTYSENSFDSEHRINTAAITADFNTPREIPANTWFAFWLMARPEDSTAALTTDDINGIYSIAPFLGGLRDKVSTLAEDYEGVRPYLPILHKEDFSNGYLSSGGTAGYDSADQATYFYQVTMTKAVKYNKPMTVVIDDGYNIVLHYYSSSTVNSAYRTEYLDTKTGSVTIPADQYFAFLIRFNPADTSRAMSVDEALSHVRLRTLADDVSELTDNVEGLNSRVGAIEGKDKTLLPDYWKTYIDGRLTELKAAEMSIGNRGVEFAFITDVHVPRNSMNSPAILQYLSDKLNLPFVINGGDTLDADADQTTAMNRFYLWREKMKSLKEFCVRGNHDLNNYNGNNAQAALTAENFYRMMISPVEWFITSNGENYYTIDNDNQKIRIIVLSTSFGGSGSENTWFRSKLTELSDEWSVIVVTHYMWASTIESFHGVGTNIINAINAVYGIMNATLIAVFAGHTHHDNAIKEATNGYNIIATTCDARTGEYTRTAGTTSEHAFDLVFINTSSRTITMKRIGAGSDRVFSY